MVSKDHNLSIWRRCGLLFLARSNLYYQPQTKSTENLQFKEIIDKQYPRYALVWIPAHGALYAASAPGVRPSQSPSIDASDVFGANLADAKHEQETPPAQDLSISASEIDTSTTQLSVCVDITYIAMQRGFLYLVATMDCTAARYYLGGFPTIGRQIFASRLGKRPSQHMASLRSGTAIKAVSSPVFLWTQALKDARLQISMDGKGRWIDNGMIERLGRSLKYEFIYVNAFETGSESRIGIGKWLAYYNTERPHSTHWILPPDEAYER